MKCSFRSGCFLVLFCVVYVSAMIDEPQCTCSRFHYEEQLLEKMIRTEMKFHALQEHLEAKLEGFTKTITDIAATTSEQLETFTKTIEDSAVKTRDGMDTFKSSIEALMEKNANELNSLVADIHKMKMEMNASLHKPNVTFRAKKLADLTPQTGQVYVFTEVLLNTGSGYDKTTGKFTASVDGTYLFTCHLCQHSSVGNDWGVMLDGREIHRGRFDFDNTACTSFDVITEMNATQSVWIQAFESDVLFEDAFRWNVFSGVLIR